MYLVPLIRSSRALTSTLLYPDNPLLAITLSESLSVVIPYINFELKHPMLVFRLISSYDNFMYMMYEEDKEKYWFTRDKMDKIIKVHDYLDSLPEVGKVLSFGSILRVAEDLNNKQLQSLEIAVLYSKIPEAIKTEIVTPYISVEKDEARISVRIKDSLKDLRRNDLIKKINYELNTKLGLEKDEYK